MRSVAATGRGDGAIRRATAAPHESASRRRVEVRRLPKGESGHQPMLRERASVRPTRKAFASRSIRVGPEGRARISMRNGRRLPSRRPGGSSARLCPGDGVAGAGTRPQRLERILGGDDRDWRCRATPRRTAERPRRAQPCPKSRAAPVVFRAVAPVDRLAKARSGLVPEAAPEEEWRVGGDGEHRRAGDLGRVVSRDERAADLRCTCHDVVAPQGDVVAGDAE